MIDFIISAIFILSFGAVLFMLARKIPVLNSLPQNGTTGIKKHRIILDIENKIKDSLLFFEKQIFLHKFLSWLKCKILKIECEIDNKLHKIRKKSQQNKK